MGATANTGTVTSVALSLPNLFNVSGSPVSTTGTLAATLVSQTAKQFFAAPNGSNGTPTFRAIVAADIPTLNQNTTGSAATLATARTINGTSFNGSANITTANWGTARTLTVGLTGKSVNGAGNVSWTLGEIGAATAAQGALADTAVQPGTLSNYVPWSDVSVAQSNDTVVQRNATGGIEAGRGSVFNQGNVVNSPLMTWTNIGAGTSGISFAAASGGTGALATTLDHQFSFSSQNLGGYLFGITGSGKPKKYPPAIS